MDAPEPPVPHDLLAIVRHAAASGFDPHRVAIALGLRPASSRGRDPDASDYVLPEVELTPPAEPELPGP